MVNIHDGVVRKTAAEINGLATDAFICCGAEASKIVFFGKGNLIFTTRSG